MTTERTSISQFPPIPGDTYQFWVVGKPEKIRAASGGTYRRWKFAIDLKGHRRNVTINLQPWQSKELLLCLGGTLEGTEVIWDDDRVEGWTFTAELVQDPWGDGKMGYKILNPRNGMPC